MKTISPYVLLLPGILLFLISCNGNFAEPEPEMKLFYPGTSYADLITKVASVQTEMGTDYKAGNTQQKDSILSAAGDYLLEVIINDFFDQWNGTEWDFNGTTRTPKQGKIACGYFITTVLYDAGFAIPRVKWAQQASEYFITRLSTDVKRFSNKSIDDITAYIKAGEDGLYIVGLDSHTGFIYKKGAKIRFVHASYYDPKIGVQSEKLDSDNPLKVSKYRVIGRILSDEMVKKWLLKESWE